MSLRWPPKDKDVNLDYTVDWSRGLDSGETIVSVNWYIDVDGTKTAFTGTVNGLTNSLEQNTSTTATIYLADGTDNFDYKIYCSVTTSSSLVRERVVRIKIREYN